MGCALATNIKYMLAGLFVSILIGCACADALEFDGEVVQLTGAQSGDILWSKSNFGGFCYNLSDGACVGTETLTIADGTLEGPNIDRVIETNALTYTTSPIWQEYELHKNLGLTVDGGYDENSGYWIEFWMGEMYVAIDGNADKLAQPLIEWGSTDTKTLAVGEEWDLGGGFALEAKQIDLDGGKVWFCLYKDGSELDSEVINTGSSNLQDRVYTYTEDVAGEDDVPIFSCYVSAIFRGTCSSIVQVKYVFLIDSDVTEIDCGNVYGLMEVCVAADTHIALRNYYSSLDLGTGTTKHIMGDMYFKVMDNASTIEFYPHLTRAETPVPSGGGGFVMDDCQIGSAWNLSEGYSIIAKDVDTGGRKARITLLNNGAVIDERILTEEFRAPVDPDCRYRYVRDGTEIITATLSAAFRGCDSNMIELSEVYQRSDADCSILLNNESHIFKTGTPTGIPWNLFEGYVFKMKDISLNGDEVWLELSKGDTVAKEKILNEDFVNTFTYISGIGGINCVVDRVFRGCEANMVKLVNVSQYSDINGTAMLVDESHFYKSADPDGMPGELMEAYVLTVNDVDLEGDKVWLELSKDNLLLKEDILVPGDLFEYRNGLESVDWVVEAVFRGTFADVVKLKNVSQYSSTGTQLIRNESKTYASADPTGEVWERWEGYSLDPKEIDLNGGKVWLALLKDGVVVKDEVVEHGWFRYYTTTGALIFSTYVDAVFRGTDTNLVQLRYTTQYSEIDGGLFVNPSNESWQLCEGYNLTAIGVYYNGSVWLQLSKNDRFIGDGLFYNGFSLQNGVTGHTIVSGTISDRTYPDVQLVSITQYSETTGAVVSTWGSKTLNETGDVDRIVLRGGAVPRVPGDVTGDGVVNIGDAVLLFNWVSFPNERGTTYVLNKPDNANVNGDTTTNIGDAVLLFNWVSFEDERGTTYILK